MSRYIDADFAHIKIRGLIARERGKLIARERGKESEAVAWDALHIIENAPTADVVEAPVRCGECKYWDSHFKECDRNCRVASSPAAYAMNFEYDDFCSYGERKVYE